jgi:HD-like signal output (HDOD) protein
VIRKTNQPSAPALPIQLKTPAGVGEIFNFWSSFLTLLRGHNTPRFTPAAAKPADAAVPQNDSSGDEAGRAWWNPPDPAFTSAQPPERPPMSNVALALERVLSSQLATHDFNFPPLPGNIQRVLAAIEDPGWDASDMADLIAEDPIRAATVLRTANSAMYGGYERITQLPAAMSRIGTIALRTIMLRESFRTTTFNIKGRDAELARAIWQRALAASHIMRALAKLTGINPEEASIIGLLCDIGAVAVLREAAEQATILHQHVESAAFEYLCHMHHENFGRHIAVAWRLPEQLQELIADHHREPKTADPLHVQRHMLQLTDMLLALLEFTPAVQYRLLESPSAAALNLANSAAFSKFLTQLPTDLQSAVRD